MRRLLIIAPLVLAGLVIHVQTRPATAAGNYEFLPVPAPGPPSTATTGENQFGNALPVPAPRPRPAPTPVSSTQAAPAIADPVAQPPTGVTTPATTSSKADLSAAYQTDDKHKLLPGDRVSFRILEDRIFESRESKNTAAPQPFIMVTDSGELDVPYIGLVSVSGKTCRQATEEIKALLERDYYYTATVIMGLDLAAKAIGRIYIAGQVRRQGAIEIPANETFTASKAILRADGFGEFAKKTKVKVIRTLPSGEKKTFELNMEEILEKGKIEKDIPLLPDDYILVPARLINL